ncbi:MAG: hypothetical protein ABI548_15710 [Polyangiaceae bacterium]
MSACVLSGTEQVSLEEAKVEQIEHAPREARHELCQSGVSDAVSAPPSACSRRPVLVLYPTPHLLPATRGAGRQNLASSWRHSLSSPVVDAHVAELR